MLVYVISNNGYPLMPTSRLGKVRRLLKNNLAKVINRCPFTIKLLYDLKEEHIQDINLGIDSGFKNVGVSATTSNKVLFESDIILRTDVSKLLSDRKETRKIRRFRTTRYRMKRWLYRKRGKGWFPPSLKNKIECHVTIINNLYKILPIKKIIIEVASFDIEKMKNPDIQGVDYQNGPQKNFWNTREYVLSRDDYKCQNPNCNHKNKILNVHHIISRKTGSNSPDNLITLCKTCHDAYHAGKIKLNFKASNSFKSSACMNTIRYRLVEEIRRIYDNVHITYGYITKNTRIRNNLPKEHYIDARCISGNPLAKSSNIVYFQRKMRCHNRKIHKNKFIKGGIRKSNQSPKYVFGYQLYDKVLYNNKECFIYGRRTRGVFDVRELDGTKINSTVLYKKLKLIEKRKSYIIEMKKI